MVLIKSYFSVTVLLKPLYDNLLSDFLPYGAQIPCQIFSQHQTPDSIFVFGIENFLCFDYEFYFLVLTES